MFSVAHSRFFGVFSMGCNGWCTAHCSLDALPLCSLSASPLLVIVCLWPYPPACPVTIDIHGLAAISLRSLKLDSCRDLCCSGFVPGRNCDLCTGYRTHLERIWRASGYTGEHLVHMHPVNVWFLGEGFPSSTDEETSGNTSRGLIPSLTILVQCRFITFESNMLMFTGFEHDFILVYILYWSAYVCLYAELDYICTIYERKQN